MQEYRLVLSLSAMYNCLDMDFLLQLPVKPRTMYFVKFTYVYITETAVSAALLIPMLTAFAVGAKNGGVTLSALYYVMIPFFVFVAPVVPLAIVSILAIPVQMLLQFIKNKPFLKLLLCFLLFVGIIGLLLYNPDPQYTYEGIADSITATAISFSKVFFYNRFLALSVSGAGFFKYFALYLIEWGTCALLISEVISKKYYALINALTLKGGTRSLDIIKIKSTTVKNALLIREFKLLFEDITFAFISLMGVMLSPLLIVMTNIIPTGDAIFLIGEKVSLNPVMGELVDISFLLVYAMMSLGGMAFAAIFGITREGKTFYFNKFLPVTGREVIKAKLMLSYIISGIGVALTVLATAVILDFGALNIIMLAVFETVFALAFDDMGLYRDLARPTLDWTSSNDVTKKNLYPMMPLFYGLALGLIPIISAIFIDAQSDTIGSTPAILLYWFVNIAMAVALKIYNSRCLKLKGDKMFDDIVCN